MSEELLTWAPPDELTLADAVNRVLDRGVLAAGDVVVSVAGVDLVYLGLQLAVSSVETLRRREQTSPDAGSTLLPAGSGRTGALPADSRSGAAPLFPVRSSGDSGLPHGEPAAAAAVPGAPAPRTRADSVPHGGMVDRVESSPLNAEAVAGDVDTALAQLVLTVVELLRRVLEHQAVRRMEGGSLSDEEVERLGLTLLRLQERLDDIKRVFGLTDEDLNIDLGPLGRLL